MGLSRLRQRHEREALVEGGRILAQKVSELVAKYRKGSLGKLPDHVDHRYVRQHPAEDAHRRRRDDRPLLRDGDPEEILKSLMDERYPIYGKADITVDSTDGPPRITVDRVTDALDAYIADQVRQADGGAS